MRILGVEFGGHRLPVEQVNLNSATMSLERGSERFSWKRLLYEMGFVVGGLVAGTMLGLSAGVALSGPESVVSMITMAGGGLAGTIAGEIIATRLAA